MHVVTWGGARVRERVQVWVSLAVGGNDWLGIGDGIAGWISPTNRKQFRFRLPLPPAPKIEDLFTDGCCELASKLSQIPSIATVTGPHPRIVTCRYHVRHVRQGGWAGLPPHFEVTLCSPTTAPTTHQSLGYRQTFHRPPPPLSRFVNRQTTLATIFENPLQCHPPP